MEKMTFMENLALVGTAATILGVFLTVYAIINNKTLKKESKLTREALEKESSLTREMIKETTEYVVKYLGDLIVAEGGRTRKAIESSAGG
ncbi:MAG: hypothetical protein QME81_12560 [bacterium]|nr:hypothetical protein [bacterium]